MKNTICFLFVINAGILFGQPVLGLLQSGPMVGYSEMREVQLWVQTKSAATVQIAYWVNDGTATQDTFLTNTMRTSQETAFTAKLTADQVQPNRAYAYQLRINGSAVALPYPCRFESQPLWQWRTNAPDFTVALGSCTYINEEEYDRPGTPYGAGYEIFKSISSKKPNMMLWLGDNTYLREADWNTRTGILHRYTHTRAAPELQELLAAAHHYAIWDDHDFGPNDADRSFIHKDKTLEAFKLFWVNPTFGTPEIEGTMTTFRFYDVDFFLLDDRYHRTPNDKKAGERFILGKAQLDWLVENLVNSKAPFKLVAIGGQVLNPVQRFENYSNYPEERNYLLQRIEDEGIRGVIFLTGDRHHTELTKLITPSETVFYDLTVSPLTSGVSSSGKDEANALRVEGTCVVERNFGMLSFSGEKLERNMKIEIFNTNGELIWDKNISVKELYQEKQKK